MRIFKLNSRDTWHILNERYRRNSYCNNARTHGYGEEGPDESKVTIAKVQGNNFPKLCKACVQHAYEDEVIDIYIKELEE